MEGHGNKPILLILLGVLAMLNSLASLTFGVLTLLGNRTAFEPSGAGPNRVAIADLLGPLGPYTGWVLLVAGLSIGAVGYGLFAAQPWSRYLVLAVLGLLAVLMVGAVAWGVWAGHLGVVLAGVLKFGLLSLACWYLNTPAVCEAFSRG